MATRTIQASITSGYNVDHEPGGYAKFNVSSDTGPVANANATGGSLTLSRVKVYSSAFYLAVSFGGGTLAATEACTANSGEAQTEEYALDDVDDDILSGSPSSITLTVQKVSGDKSKINFREGCTLTLEIEYEEKGSGGGGGDDPDDGEGGDPIEGLPVEECTPAENVKLSATKSYGDPVMLTWEHHKRKSDFQSMYVMTEYSDDLVTWKAVSPNKSVLHLAQETVDQGVPLCTFACEVSPPTVLGAYHRFRIGSIYIKASVVSEYTQPLQYVAPINLLEYTDVPLVAGETPVKAVHMIELQTNINMLRESQNLPAYEFSEIVSERTSLADWSAHVVELRTALDETDKTHPSWIALDINQPRADIIEQLRSAVSEDWEEDVIEPPIDPTIPPAQPPEEEVTNN